MGGAPGIRGCDLNVTRIATMLTALSGESSGGGPVRTPRWAYIGNLLLVFFVSAPVLGQDTATASPAHARQWLSAGELAFAQGRFGDALDAFEASYRTQRQPQTLRRIGDAADKLGSHARAAEAWQAYLKYVPDAPDREYIASRIEANHAALSPTHPRTVNLELAPMTASSDQQHGHTATDSAAPRITHPGESPNPRSERSSQQAAGPIWLWAAGGAAVIAGIVIAAVVISSGGSPSTTAPVQGNVGSAIQTLGSR
jgi:tetratricopeptide (TPR) repeat protein